MRHRNKVKKLGRKTAHRKSMISNQAISLFKHKSIQTTTEKAKVLRSFAERMITSAKKNTIATRRHVYSKMHNKEAVKILFDEIAPKFADKESGYTRITKIGFRKGDGAETALIELLLEPEKTKSKKTEKKAEKSKIEVNKETEEVSKKEEEPIEENFKKTKESKPIIKEKTINDEVKEKKVTKKNEKETKAEKISGEIEEKKTEKKDNK
jgi:large subunit ribosomal protein L17